MLHRFNLLKSLLAQMLTSAVIAQVLILDEHLEQVQLGFLQQRGIEAWAQWAELIEQLGRTQEEGQEHPRQGILWRSFLRECFAAQAQARLMDYKNALEQVVCSQLRLENSFLARALSLQIESGESNFVDLAKRYAEGMDQNANGIICPVSLTQAHPALTEKLLVERGKSLGASNKVGFAQLPKGCPNEGAPCTSADISIDSFHSSDFVVPKEKLTRIGSNAVGPDPQEQGQELSFPLTIQLDDQQLRLKGGSSLPLQVGMSPTANIKLRKVSYLQLLLGEFPDNAESLQRL